MNLASPASVAARARTGRPSPGAGWGTSAGEFSNANRGTGGDIARPPGIHDARRSGMVTEEELGSSDW
jgi:hypothetical protein